MSGRRQGQIFILRKYIQRKKNIFVFKHVPIGHCMEQNHRNAYIFHCIFSNYVFVKLLGVYSSHYSQFVGIGHFLDIILLNKCSRDIKVSLFHLHKSLLHSCFLPKFLSISYLLARFLKQSYLAFLLSQQISKARKKSSIYSNFLGQPANKLQAAL